MCYEVTNKIEVVDFAKKVVKARDRYVKYIETHCFAIENNTARSYRSNWRKADEEFRDAQQSYIDFCKKAYGFNFKFISDPEKYIKS